MRRLSFLFLLFALGSVLVAASDRRKEDIWVPMEERVKIWDEVVSKELSLPLPLPEPKPYVVSANGLEATFEKDGVKWTIIGANAPIVNPTVYPKDWPVKGDDFEVLVIPEPITNYKILPFTEKIENAVKSDTITITAAKDSYELASFVIRSGDVDLKDVMIEVTDMKAKVRDKNGKIKTAIIPKENIDVRVVKCWYQAGADLWLGRGVRKLLTPELLVYDDNLVHVDHKRQINLIRNLERIEDGFHLKPFHVTKRENKQVWLTIKVPDESPHGEYSGHIYLKGSLGIKKLSLKANVLPFKLEKSILEYSMFYLVKHITDTPQRISSAIKSERQMLLELKDMKEHGIDNPAIEQRNFDLTLTENILSLRGKAGLKNDPLLYVEWPKLIVEEEALTKLRHKVSQIVDFAKERGIKEIYFYAVDELKGADLIRERPMLAAIRAAGAKTFVACKFDFMGRVDDLLDMPIVNDPPSPSLVKRNKDKGNKMWIYGNPQCGVEEPETYRRNYGLTLLKWGLDGTCNYAYQCDMGASIWNDFDFERFRDHVMAYPTINGVIPTIQWEGWRQGVNDVRYLSTLLKISSEHDVDEKGQRSELLQQLVQGVDDKASLYLIRNRIIDHILKTRIAER
jgi:hypothetical protein